MIQEIYVKGYRSLQDIRFTLNQINVVSGPNGCGKSNVYRALQVLARSAAGNIAQQLTKEGGMPSVLWAGEKVYPTRTPKPVRMILGFRTEEWSYEIGLGLPNATETFFSRDPEVKEEFAWYGISRRPSTTFMERQGASVWVLDKDLSRVAYPFYVSDTDSVLSQLHEPHLYPELSAIRQMIYGWRFYHHFRTDQDAPLRFPQIGVRTPVLSENGDDLAAALRTIMEIGDDVTLEEVVDAAFPGCKLTIRQDQARLEVLLSQPGIRRPLEAKELSDGTLRYLCLIAALLSPRPPRFMILNEPETSLHPELIPALARLIKSAARQSQIWLTTHSQELVQALSNSCDKLAHCRLEKMEGATRLS